MNKNAFSGRLHSTFHGACFPDAKFIHIIRDGRDSVLSALKKWSDRYWYYDTYYLLQTWKQNVTFGRQAASWLGPERYLEIRYEKS